MWSSGETCHCPSLVEVSFLVCIHHPKACCFYKFPAWQVFHPQISERVEALEHIFSACRQVSNYGLINHSSACTCLYKTASVLLCDPCRSWECCTSGYGSFVCFPLGSAAALTSTNDSCFVGTGSFVLCWCFWRDWYILGSFSQVR